MPQLVYLDAPGLHLDIDCTLTETHKAEVEVTDHPVETGVNVADHARPKPVEVTLEGVLTNTPFDSSLGPFPAGQAGPANAGYLTLIDLHDNPQMVTISTALRAYLQMMLTSLSVKRDGKTGDAVAFEAVFKQIRTVVNQTTTVATKIPRHKLPVKTTGVTSRFTPPQASGGPKALKALAKLNLSGAPK